MCKTVCASVPGVRHPCVIVRQHLNGVKQREMTGKKGFVVDGVGYDLSVVTDACGKEFQQVFHVAIFAGKPLRRSGGCPYEDGGKVQCGLVSDGELVRSQGQAAPLLESVDAPLDRVALLVSLGVEDWWPAAVAASPQPVADLVGRLGDDCADPASPEVIPNQAG